MNKNRQQNVSVKQVRPRGRRHGHRPWSPGNIFCIGSRLAWNKSSCRFRSCIMPSTKGSPTVVIGSFRHGWYVCHATLLVEDPPVGGYSFQVGYSFQFGSDNVFDVLGSGAGACVCGVRWCGSEWSLVYPKAPT